MRAIKIFIFVFFLISFIANKAYAGTWTKSDNGWQYKNDSGNSVSGAWEWIDGNGDGVSECYCFDKNGIMYADTTTPDGYRVNPDGAWTENGKVMTRSSFPFAIPSKYSDVTKAHINEFLNSYNFSSADDYSKAKAVYERIAAGFNGNIYDASTTGTTRYADHMQILDYKKGICHDFAEDYVTLARLVGLSADTYQPTLSHEEVLVKISGNWYKLDPSSGNSFEAALMEADYDSHINMAEDNFWNSDAGERSKKANEYSEKWQRGEISYDEFVSLTDALYGR